MTLVHVHVHQAIIGFSANEKVICYSLYWTSDSQPHRNLEDVGHFFHTCTFSTLPKQQNFKMFQLPFLCIFHVRKQVKRQLSVTLSYLAYH